MNQLKQLEDILRNLRFGETADNLPELLKKAEKNEITYVSFLMDVMKYEQKRREEKKIGRHLKWATFPYHKTLEEFDLKEQQSLSNKQFNK